MCHHRGQRRGAPEPRNPRSRLPPGTSLGVSMELGRFRSEPTVTGLNQAPAATRSRTGSNRQLLLAVALRQCWIWGARCDVVLCQKWSQSSWNAAQRSLRARRHTAQRLDFPGELPKDRSRSARPKSRGQTRLVPGCLTGGDDFLDTRVPCCAGTGSGEIVAISSRSDTPRKPTLSRTFDGTNSRSALSFRHEPVAVGVMLVLPGMGGLFDVVSIRTPWDAMRRCEAGACTDYGRVRPRRRRRRRRVGRRRMPERIAIATLLDHSVSER